MSAVIVVLPILGLTLSVLVANRLGTWAWLSGSDYGPDISDVRQITATADCVLDDRTWSLNVGDVRPQWLGVQLPSRLGAGFRCPRDRSGHTAWAGFVVLVVLLASIGGLGWIAIDRGNSDILTCALVVLTAPLSISSLPVLLGLLPGVAGVAAKCARMAAW